MKQAPIILSIILVCIGVITVYLSALGFSRRQINGALEFGLFMLSVSLYTFGYAIELAQINIYGVLSAIKFEYLGISFMSPFLLMFVYRFISGRSLKKNIIVLLMVVPVVSLLLVYSLEYHTFYYINPRIVDNGYFTVFTFENGIWYNIRFVYQQLISLFVIVYLLYCLIFVEQIRRAQIAILLACILVPSVTAFFYHFSVFPGHVDINAFTGAFPGLGFCIAIFRYKLFELVPLARDIAIDSINEGFFVIDNVGVVQDSNRSSSHFKILPEIKTGDMLNQESAFTIRLMKAVTENEPSFEYEYEGSISGKKYYMVKLYKVGSSRERFGGIAVLLTDMTDTRILLEKLEKQATHDVLTGIYNRRYLAEVGNREIEISQRNALTIGFIIIDIDHFKKINDTYGHHFGDTVLVKVSECFRNSCRNIDIVGRWGGEEFLVICPNTDREGVLYLAERLRASLVNCEIICSETPVHVTASFGATSIRAQNNNFSIDDAVRQADEALYRAKHNGRNRVEYSVQNSLVI